jgi:excisionase family DNA binding protein
MVYEELIEKTADIAAKRALEKIGAYHEYLTTEEASKYLNVSTQYLEIARHKGDGPPYIKLARAVRYKRTDLDSWMGLHREAG